MRQPSVNFHLSPKKRQVRVDGSYYRIKYCDNNGMD